MSRMRTRSEAKLSRKKSSGLSESNAIIDLTDGLQRNGEKVVTESMTSLKKSSHSVKSDSKVRTPKVKSKNKHAALTPVRDDFLLSQHFDSQVVVGWDCNSPDTIRGIKRFTDEENGDDVSDLVMQLCGDEHEGILPTKRSTPPLLGVWREDTEDKLLDDHHSNRLRKRARQRRKSGKESCVTNDLLNKLSLAFNKCPEDDKEKNVVVEADEEETAALHNCSDDLFGTEIDTVVENTLIVKHSHVSPRVLENKPDKNNSKPTGGLLKDKNIEEHFEQNSDTTTLNCDIEEDWSDDELFEDNSFNIVKDTQVQADEKKFVSPVFGLKRKSSDESLLPKTKTTRYTYQLGRKETKKQNIIGNTNFTSLQNKHSDRIVGAAPDTVVVTTTSIKMFQSGSLTTTSISKQPIVCQVSSANKPVPSSNIKCSQQVIASQCAKPVFSNSIASTSGQSLLKTQNCSSQKQVTGTNVCSSSNFYPKNVYKSVLVATQNTNTNLTKPVSVNNSKPSTVLYQSNSSWQKSQKPDSFKKHNSFSGSHSPKSASSRRRSMSGSGCDDRPGVNSTTTVIKPTGAANTLKHSAPSNFVSKSTCNNVSVNSSSKTLQPGSIRTSINMPSTAQTAVSRSKTATTHTTSPTTSAFSKPLPVIQEVEQSRTSLDGFDTSFSDELLCQLAEPDELLDSQVVLDSTVANVRVTQVPVKSVQTTKQVPVNSRASQAPVNKVKPITQGPVSSVQSQPVGNNKHRVTKMSVGANLKPSHGITISKIANNQNKQDSENSMIVNSDPDVVQPTQSVKQYKFRSCGNKPGVITRSKISQSASATEKSKVRPLPMQTKQEDTEAVALGQYSEDLFTSDDDADLLLNNDDLLLDDDDSLTEPQILAMLDEAELLATQKQNNQKSGVSNIKTKEKETSLMLSKSNSSNNVVEAITNIDTDPAKTRTSDHGSEPSSSQSSSQTKYSAEDIEKKKQEAMERRKKKLEQTKVTR